MVRRFWGPSRRRGIDVESQDRESKGPMKTFFVLVALVMATPAFARVGETVEQLNQRYGKPTEIKQGPVDKKGGAIEMRRYVFRGFSILVGLENGISQGEVYRKEDRSRMLQSEISGLIAVNAGSSPWREPDDNIETLVFWSKDKKTRVGIYTLATHSLLITTKAFMTKFAQAADDHVAKKVEGF